MNIEDIKESGFNIEDPGIANMSLSIALNAYFSTYQDMKDTLHIFGNNILHCEKDHFLYHTKKYKINYTEAIVHFHHFIELFCKNILRDINPNLVDNCRVNNHLLQYKLVMGEVLSDADRNQLHTIDYNTTIQRINCYLKDNNTIINDSNLLFIKDNFKVLEEVGKLRNMLIHKGTYILPYIELDILIGKYVMPFILKVMEVTEYGNNIKSLLKLELACDIDPISEIVTEMSHENFNFKKVAFLKEMARAAYLIPVRQSTIRVNKESNRMEIEKIKMGTKLRLGTIEYELNKDKISRAEKRAEIEASIEEIGDIKNCPVCGIKSFVIFEFSEFEGEDGYHYEKVYHIPYRASCMACTFNINYHLDNPKNYGYDIEDYWYTESN